MTKTMSNNNLLYQSIHKPTADELNKWYGDTAVRFCLVGGILYSIAECALFDTLIYAKDVKKQGLWGRWLKDALKYTERNGIDDFCKDVLGSKFQLWTDVTDIASEELKLPLMHLRVAISNIVINSTEKYTDFKTSALYTLMLYSLAVSFFDNFFIVQRKKYGYDFSKDFKDARNGDIHKKVYAVCNDLCRDILPKVFNSKDVSNSQNEIVNFIGSENWMNKVSYRGLKINGEYDEELASIKPEQ